MMPFPLRLFLHVVAVGLLVACLAYWWLDHLAHEVFGTLLFALVILHIAINRRWYGAIVRGRYGVARSLNTATIVGLAISMILMLVTSVLISRNIFAFASIDGAFGVREVHMFGAYWVVLIVAIHLGLRWAVVMMIFRRMFGISKPNALRSLFLRTAVIFLAVLGVRSSFETTFGAKLLLTYTLDMWDFNESPARFFVNYGTIVTLIAALSHYGSLWTRRLERRPGHAIEVDGGAGQA
jgi:hypothetical protein